MQPPSGVGIDMLDSLLKRGEQLRDKMALSQYHDDEVMETQDYDPTARRSAGAGYAAGAVLDDSDLHFHQLDDDDDGSTSWMLHSLDSSTNLPLHDDDLLEDLFYNDGEPADPEAEMLAGQQDDTRQTQDNAPPTQVAAPQSEAGAPLRILFQRLKVAPTSSLSLGANPENCSVLLLCEHGLPPPGQGASQQESSSLRIFATAFDGAVATFEQEAELPCSGAQEDVRITLFIKAATEAFHVVGHAHLAMQTHLRSAQIPIAQDLQVIADGGAERSAPEHVGRLQLTVLPNATHPDEVASLPHPHATTPHSHSHQGSAVSLSASGAHPKQTLHLLLEASHIKDTHQHQHQHQHQHHPERARNLFLVCRALSPTDQSQSEIHWSTDSPHFAHRHALPVVHNSQLLEQLRQGLAVVEVWDRCGDSATGRDEMFGLVKLSLNQFYLAYQNENVAEELLQGELPVIAFNGYRPVINPFTNATSGLLHLVLLMGSCRQVAKWSREATIAQSTTRQMVRETTSWLRSDGPLTAAFHGRGDPASTVASTTAPVTGGTVKHTFEVTVKSISNLNAFEDTLHGEADCFVQFNFPESLANRTMSAGQRQNRSHRQPHRTPATECGSTVIFDALSMHSLVLGSGQPVSTEMAHCLEDGLDFEVWQRLYYPTVCEQLLGKATLNLADIEELVNAQRNSEPAQQSWDLNVCSYASQNETYRGTLHLLLSYHTHESEPAASKQLQNAQKTSTLAPLHVQVLNVTGLQAAVDSLVVPSPELSFTLNVGVNSYIRVMRGNARAAPPTSWSASSIVNRSFAPEFNHEFKLNGDGKHVTVELWHREAPSASASQVRYHEPTVSGSKGSQEMLLATARIAVPNIDPAFLTSAADFTTYTGWYPLLSPHAYGKDTDGVGAEEAAQRGTTMLSSWREVGAIELSFKDIGSISSTNSHAPIVQQAAWVAKELQVLVDEVYIPASEHRLSNRGGVSRFYVKYSVLNRACTTPPRSLDTNAPVSVCIIDHESCHSISTSAEHQTLFRQQLELKLFGAVASSTSTITEERYLGSAFVDLLPFVSADDPPKDLCGVFPIIQRGVASLFNVRIKARISLCNLETASADNATSPVPALFPVADLVSDRQEARDEAEGVSAYITIEKATNLPHVYNPASDELNGLAPTTYVSYQVNSHSNVECTDIVDASASPVWHHRRCVRLVLAGSNGDAKSLIFKLWHKSSNGNDADSDPLVNIGDRLVGTHSCPSRNEHVSLMQRTCLCSRPTSLCVCLDRS